jgi:MacB-like periplasmic core domain
VLAHPSFDGGVLSFSAGLAFLTAALVGMAPALSAIGKDLNEAIEEVGRSSTSNPCSQRLRGLLVSCEVALAVVALVGAGLFLKSLYVTKAIQPGFDPGHVALARFNLSAGGFDAQQADAFCRHLREQLEKQPGISAVTYSDYVPLSLSAGSWEDLEIQGYVPGPSEDMKIYRNLVAPGYFSLMKIPLLEGREFNSLDDSDHPWVMVVTHEFVRRFIPSGAAIGRKVRGWGEWFTIAASILIVVGVASWALFFKQKGSPVVQTAVLDLRNRSVPRGGEPTPGEQPLELSRAVKHLNVYLPRGSAEGPYELRIATTTRSAIFTTNGVASLKDGVTSMDAALELSSAPSGRYVLQIRRPDSEWNSYPLLLR